jgi:tetratricopeptide (TPR) repeat protein
MSESPSPADGDPHDLFARALGLHRSGRLLEAIADYDRAIALKPDHTNAHNNRGNALFQLGYYDVALASYDQAIALQPDYATAHNNRGSALNRLGRHDEALASYDRAIMIDSDYAGAYNNRGHTLNELGRHEEALTNFEQAVTLKPDYADAHNNRGNVLNKLGHHDQALASFDRAIALTPHYAGAHNNRAHVLYQLGRYQEALASCNRAIALQPDFAAAQTNRALLLNLFGDYKDGFDNYEWRLRGTPSKFTQPQWCGEPITDKTILLSAEQGFGDIMQMLRYLPLVKAKASHIVLGLPRTIPPLLGPMADGVTVITPGSPLPPFDVHCPLMSLPFAFGTGIDTIPAQVPYLTAPAERMPWWRERLPKSAALRVGLVWSGRADYASDSSRTIALDRLAPLLEDEDISFVSLQREYRDHDLPALSRLPIERIDDVISDFGDTAAAIEQCDLVISIDTSVAHLAGGLGKPVWILLPHVPDWRWLLDRTDCPWYPTARLFRQNKTGDWHGVIADVIRELSAFRNSRFPSASAKS